VALPYNLSKSSPSAFCSYNLYDLNILYLFLYETMYPQISTIYRKHKDSKPHSLRHILAIVLPQQQTQISPQLWL
jgi:hypothetical protein